MDGGDSMAPTALPHHRLGYDDVLLLPDERELFELSV
jgi:hypothetical protein